MWSFKTAGNPSPENQGLARTQSPVTGTSTAHFGRMLAAENSLPSLGRSWAWTNVAPLHSSQVPGHTRWRRGSCFTPGKLPNPTSFFSVSMWVLLYTVYLFLGLLSFALRSLSLSGTLVSMVSLFILPQPSLCASLVPLLPVSKSILKGRKNGKRTVSVISALHLRILGRGNARKPTHSSLPILTHAAS